MRRHLLASSAVAAALAASLTVAMVSSASATDGRRPAGTPNAQLPAAIQVDESAYRVVETLIGVGKQVYDCVGGRYTLREPVAGLLGAGNRPAGIHGAGPFWASLDGSRVVGTSPVAAPSPDGPSNIAWLKIQAASNAGQGGVFSEVDLIQRTDTRGGVAPATCAAPTIAVDYSTTYVFWAPK